MSFFLRQVFSLTPAKVSITQKLVRNLSPIAIANYTYICNEFRVIGKLSIKYYVFTEVYEKLKMHLKNSNRSQRGNWCVKKSFLQKFYDTILWVVRKRALERWGKKMKGLKKELAANSRGRFSPYWMSNVKFEYYQNFVYMTRRYKKILLLSSLMKKNTFF